MTVRPVRDVADPSAAKLALYEPPADHLRNFVSLHTPDDGKSVEASTWLLGNGVVEIPLGSNSAAQLRAGAAMLSEAAGELDGLVADIIRAAG